MTEPINIQLNVLQSAQEIPRQQQANKDVEQRAQMGQEMNRAKESETEPETVQNRGDAEQARLSKDGSGRGRAFQRRRGKKKSGEEDASAADAAEPVDASRGSKVDFLR